MTRAGVSERRRASVSELTPDRFRELRWVAEAVSDVCFEVAGSTGRRMGINGIPFSFECGECGFLLETNQAVVALSPVGYFIANFDPPMAIALLDEIERLRRERETLAAAVRAREEARRAAISPYRPSSEPVSETLRLERLHSEACKRDEAAHQKALALLAGEKDGDRCE